MDGDCVICYTENNTIENPLCKGNLFFNSKCNCNYFVHKECIEKWNQLKSPDNLCIICNSPMKPIIQETVLEIDNLDIPIQNEASQPYIITTHVINNNNPENDDDCCDDTAKRNLCFIVSIIFIFFIIISA